MSNSERNAAIKDANEITYNFSTLAHVHVLHDGHDNDDNDDDDDDDDHINDPTRYSHVCLLVQELHRRRRRRMATLQVLFSLLSYRQTSPSFSLSDRPNDYTVGPPIGFGASSVVYAAVYNPPPPELPRPFPCALKVLDLDSLPPHSLALLQRETQLMSLSKHPNVLRVRGSWVDGHKLHIALRLMNKGSAADIMNYSWPGGMEEEVVKCILKQALDGLK